MKKPQWVIDKEKTRRADAQATLWLFGLHAVRDALMNPMRERVRLVLTRNAADRLGEAALAAGGLEPEIADPRKFPVPLDPGSVHQGAALEVRALDWGRLEDVCAAPIGQNPRVVLLDRVTDPHNVGAILRSAEVFGARAVIAPKRHAAPETGALAKTASGALERQPYLRVQNLGTAMETLRDMGYALVGLDGAAEQELGAACATRVDQPLALVMGAEGPGLRERTRELCDTLARIGGVQDGAQGDGQQRDGEQNFGSLNVSNAAAVALYAATRA
jgi:23S rRNA (guanosine2251-2'-O)-methyltransferase